MNASAESSREARCARGRIAIEFILLAILVMPWRMLLAAEQERFLTGQILVATDAMRDPRFAQSLIYIVRHDADGTLGLVVNRPIAKGSLDDLLKGFGVQTKNAPGEIIIHFGGPVSTRQGFVLHSDEVLLENSIRVKDGLAMTSDVKLLEAIAQGKGPRQSLFMFGYAGWAPGQLEAEIKADSWFSIPGDKTLIFGKDAEGKWKQATARRQIPL